MPDPGVTLTSLANDIRRLERNQTYMVTQREIDDVKADVAGLERKLDQLIQNQISGQRTAILQLVSIFVTMALAAYGIIL